MDICYKFFVSFEKREVGIGKIQLKKNVKYQLNRKKKLQWTKTINY